MYMQSVYIIHPYIHELYQKTQSKLKGVQSMVDNEDFLWFSFNNRIEVGLLLWHPRYLISYETTSSSSAAAAAAAAA